MGRPGCSGCCEQEDRGCDFTPTVKFWHKNRDNDNVQSYTAEEYKGEFGDQAVDRRILEVGDIVKWQEQPVALVVENKWKIMDTNLPNENSYDLRNVEDNTIRKVNIGRWFLLMLVPVNPDRPDTRFELPDFKGISVEFQKPYVQIKRIPELWHDGNMVDDWGQPHPEGYFVSFTGENQVWQIIDNRGRNDLGLVEFEIKTVNANRREVVTEDDVELASEDYKGWYDNINTDQNGDMIDPPPHPDAPQYPFQGYVVSDRTSGVRTGCSGPFFNFGNEKGTDTTHTEKAVPNDIPLSHLAKLPDPKDLQNSHEIFVAGGWLMRVGHWGDAGLMGYSGANETDEHHAFDFLLHRLTADRNNPDTREQLLANILDNGWGDTPVYASWLYDVHYLGNTTDIEIDHPVWNAYNHNIFGIAESNAGWFNPPHQHTTFHVEDVFYSKVVNQAVYHKIDEEGNKTDVKKWLEVVNKGNPFLSLNYISSSDWTGYNDPGNLSRMLDDIADLEDPFDDDIGYIAPYGSYCINKDIAYMDSHSYYSDWNIDFYVDNLGQEQFSNGYKAYKVQGVVGGPRYVRSHKLYVDGDSYTIAERDPGGNINEADSGTIADWNYRDKIKTITYFWPSRSASSYTFSENSPFPDPKDDNYKYYNLYQANPGYFEGKLSLDKVIQDGGSGGRISSHHASHLFADGYLMNPRQLNDYRGAEDNNPVQSDDWWDTKPRNELATEMESLHITPYSLVRDAKPRSGDVTHGSEKLKEYFDDAENMSEFKKQFWCQWSSYAETDNMQIVKVNTVDTHEKGSAIHGELWSWVYFIKVLNSLNKGKGWESTRYLSGKGRGEQITGINIGGDDYWDNVTGTITESKYRPKDELEVGDFFFSKFDFKQNDNHDIEDWLVPDNDPEEERHGLIDFGLHAVEQYLWEITEIVKGVGYRAKRVVGGGLPRVFAPNQIITSVNQDNRSLLCLSAIKELDAAGAIDINKITINGKIAWEVKGNHLNIHWPHLKIKNMRLIEKLAKQWAVIKDANWEPQADLFSMPNPENSYITPSADGINAAQRRIGDPYETYFTHDAANRTDKPVSAFAFLVKGKFWKTPFYAISGNVQIIYDLDTVEEVRE